MPMLKMDISTKQVFLSGLLVYFSTISGLIFSYSNMQENHSVRIEHLEDNSYEANNIRKQLTVEMGNQRTNSATLKVLLEAVNKSVLQLNDTTNELGKVTSRLEERSRIQR